jgi:hypothetical protein
MGEVVRVYVVIRTAVYRHQIGGVFSTEENALETARALIATEPDDHHDYEILEFLLDTPSYVDGKREYPGSFKDGRLVVTVKNDHPR